MDLGFSCNDAKEREGKKQRRARVSELAIRSAAYVLNWASGDGESFLRIIPVGERGRYSTDRRRNVDPFFTARECVLCGYATSSLE